jgi:hypothetical protein
MAEPTADPVLKVLPYLIPAIASILVPIVGWILSSTGLGRKQKQIEYFIRRLDLNEKLRTLAEKGLGEEDLRFLKAESEEILNYLKLNSLLPRQSYTVMPARLARLRSTFLLYDPGSTKGWVYHIMFYFSLLGVFSGFTIYQKDVGMSIYVVVLYLVMAFVFQRLAHRNMLRTRERKNVATQA